MLRSGASCNVQDCHGQTPLHFAFLPSHYLETEDDVELIEKMLRFGADSNIRDVCGCTALHMAVRAGCNVEVVQMLVTSGADPQAVDKQGKSSLHCVYNRHVSVAVIEYLVQQGCDLSKRDNNGNTPLHELFDCAAIKCMIENGAEINAQNKAGKTPLHEAARPWSGCMVTQHLLDHGADPEIGDNEGNTALHVAMDSSSLAHVKLFVSRCNVNLQNRQGKTALHLALKGFHRLEATQCLLDHGADPEIADNEGNTALHVAATHLSSWEEDEEDIQCIKLLLGRCNLNSPNHHGKTVLHLSVKYSCGLITQCLLDHGADPEIVDYEGNTALHVAVNIIHDDENDNEDNICILLNTGCSVNIQNYAGQTPLHRVMDSNAWNEYITYIGPPMLSLDANSQTMSSLVSRLLQHSCNVNIIDKTGRNPFLLLTYLIVEYVTKRGCTSQERGDSGDVYNEACDLQVLDNFRDMFRELLNKASDPNCRDTNGNTPLIVFGQSIKPVFDHSLAPLILQLLDCGADIGLHNMEGQSFYSLFKEYTRVNHSESVQHIQDILQVPSLQCLSIHSVYPLRDRIRRLPYLPTLIKSYLNLD